MDEQLISRRRAVRLFSAPMIGATVAATLSQPQAAAAEAAAGEEKLLGARLCNIRDFGATGPGGRAAQTQPAKVDRPHLLVFYRCTNLLLRDAFLTRSAYHCCRILQCKYVRIDGIRIYNRVNKNNDGFHFNDTQYVNIINCNVQCQDDACALFGSNKFVTVTNCSFSTRWSIFRFGGGECENITVSNCIIYDTYGCPIKMSCGPRSRIENMIFSNLVLKDVTGPISIGLRSAAHPS